MDWSLAVTIVGIVVTVAIFIARRIHVSDWNTIRTLKADSDYKIDSLSHKIDNIETYLKDKLDKQDHLIAFNRVDKELDAIRKEQREDFNRIEQKIDLKIDKLMELIISRTNTRRRDDV